MKTWAIVQEGKMVQGPMTLPKDLVSTLEKKLEVKSMSIPSGWLPVEDNSLTVDRTKFAISDDFTIEVQPDKVIKTHRVKPFPQEFIDAVERRQVAIKESK